MITAENTITEMTASEIAARRDMERERFILWHSYNAASDLYAAMLDTPNLFSEDETDAQSELSETAEAAYHALNDEYTRLYLTDGTEEA